MDRCEVPKCKQEMALVYLGRGVGETHWNRLAGENAPPDALRMALGIKATALPAMEEAMEPTSTKTSKAEVAEAAPGKAIKGTKKAPKATAKTEVAAKGKQAKAPKEPRPTKEAKAKREAVDNPVVFAFRLSEADRTRIHDAGGPAGATRFVRSAALAAATGDTKGFEALVAQARANLK